MLELGKAGESGAGKGEVPVLRGGELVARLRSTDFWKEGSVAVVGDREWVLERRKGGALAGRWTVDPEDAARLRAEQVSVWKGTWRADLEGTVVDVVPASYWKGTYRFAVGERTVAESGSTGGWSPRPTLTAGEDLTLDAQVFLLWLVLVLQRRTYGAAIAVSIGAATAGSS
ncbi:hypothetical protein GCM10027451_29010 [Geodermatophilus aquaeductus]|uniref:Uncharacterized protein n=1 Tax=Geodermatophilus aquaeductus TaxID=1564161 RepID=A0A521F5V8_9ACTN|nr:hypothetical protein [Geodermatophilus aquaeductus]SMO91476.1 hypothetical protein SAMN06273567_10762 [Geodermatophilus aquaeductus]